MAVAGQRNEALLRTGLAAWFEHRHPGARQVQLVSLTRPSSGLSSETLLIEMAWEQEGTRHAQSLVARLPPSGKGLFPDYDLARLFRIHQTLSQTAIPVPPPVALEEDPSWLQTPFLVFEQVAGRVLGTNPPFLKAGWLYESSEQQQRALHMAFLSELGRVHRLDWRSKALHFASHGHEPGLESELSWWCDYMRWASEGGPAESDLATSTKWLCSHRPPEEPPASLLWGDVQLANCVFQDDLAPAAILDWEMAGIGPAEVDIGWFLALHRMMVTICGADLPGFLDRQGTIEYYQEQLGRELLDLVWFELFAASRSAAIMARMAALLAEQGVDDSWLTRSNPTLNLVRELIDALGG